MTLAFKLVAIMLALSVLSPAALANLGCAPAASDNACCCGHTPPAPTDSKTGDQALSATCCCEMDAPAPGTSQTSPPAAPPEAQTSHVPQATSQALAIAAPPYRSALLFWPTQIPRPPPSASLFSQHIALLL